jgi:hypothetical protein
VGNLYSVIISACPSITKLLFFLEHALGLCITVYINNYIYPWSKYASGRCEARWAIQSVALAPVQRSASCWSHCQRKKIRGFLLDNWKVTLFLSFHVRNFQVHYLPSTWFFCAPNGIDIAIHSFCYHKKLSDLRPSFYWKQEFFAYWFQFTIDA